MSRYIDADALKETIASNVYPVADVFNSRDYGMFWTGGIEKAIDEQPTADVRENVRGNLVNIEPSLTLIDAIPTPSGEKALLSMDKSCSKCKTPIPPNICNNVWFKYCPFCGADLSVERADT